MNAARFDRCRSLRRAHGLQDQSGLTLVELMISILLAAILSAGLFAMMSGQQKTYTQQLGQMTAQENLWGAMEYLQSEIRKAGFGFTGCGGQVHVYYQPNTPNLQFYNAFSVRDGDLENNLLTGTLDAVVKSDSFSVLYADGNIADPTGVKLGQKYHPVTAATFWATAPGNIEQDDILVLWAPGTSLWCTVIQATQNPQQTGQAWMIQDNPSSDYNPSGITKRDLFPPNGYPPGTLVMNLGKEMKRRNFAIDRSKDPPRLVTWKEGDAANSEIVAEGIEDLQIAWTCDYTGRHSGFADDGPDGVYFEGKTDAERVTDEWYNNVPDTYGTKDTPLACQYPPGCVFPNCLTAPIGLVRISLIGRTAGPNVGEKKGYRPVVENNVLGKTGSVSHDLAATGQIGTYGRAILTSVVQPRNIRKQTL
jgi:prepilin-type N-terminal cleavage/methylation domain-containing protein